MQVPLIDRFLSVQCAEKKLPVNLTLGNPTREVLPTNMYRASKSGCLISVMFKLFMEQTSFRCRVMNRYLSPIVS